MNRYQIKQYLRKRGITYSELSEISGVSKDTIGYFLNGKGVGNVDSVEKIFEALGLDISEFNDDPVPSKSYNIEEWRRRKKELHLRFEDIVEQSGIPMSTVQDLFQGRTKSPRIDTVNAIARVLGLQKPVKEDESVAANSTLVLTDEEARLLAAFKDLIPPMRDYVLEMTEKLVDSQSKSSKNEKRA
ncbi:MAG TPA: hypothetical protein DDY77_06245 [Clostridiales bacterium]|nr:hypothetical protein [Clostridiales bacterium]